MGEYRTTEGEPPPSTPHERRSRHGRWALLIALILALIGIGGQHLRLRHEVPASGYVSSQEYAEVRSPVAGQVTEIRVGTGDYVQRNDLLVQLEDASEHADLAAALRLAEKAEAELAYRKAALEEQKRERNNRIAAAQLALDHAEQRLGLTRTLAEQGLASGRDLADHKYARQVAEASFRLLAEADETLDARQIEVLRREVEARRESLAHSRARLEARAIRAPIDGILMRYTFYEGEVVRPDLVLYEIFGKSQRILRLRVAERFAMRVRVGQPFRAKLRTHPSLRTIWFRGSVTSVRDAIQTDGPQSYRVLYTTFDPGEHEVPPGATADVRIMVGRRSLWQTLLGL